MNRLIVSVVFTSLLLASGPLSAQIKINEIIASNNASLVDEAGEADDWIEIFNNGNTTIDFGGMYVTDDPADITKWQIPADQSSQTLIGPGEYLILWFDENLEQGPLHINTKLSAAGEYVILTQSDAVTQIDSVSFPALAEDVSWGRIPDGTGGFTKLIPSPNESNQGNEVTPQTESPGFSLMSGFYSTPLTISIEVDSGAEIRYAVGGDKPTSNSALYEGPITIDTSTVIRAIAFEDGHTPSSVSTSTYLLEDKHTIPVVSFVMEPDSLFDYEKGMYVFGDSTEAEGTYPYRGANFWEEWEYPVHIEYMNTNGGVEFSFDGGASIGGNFSRAFPKKSFTINNNDEYGIDQLEYPLFPENDYSEYDGFGLRAGAEERSRLLNELMYTINLQWNHHNDMQAYKPVATYINGKYWGNYTLIERKNDDFVESRYGYDAIDMIKDFNIVKDGSFDHYENLLAAFQDENLSGAAFFSIADSLIHLPSFTDHWIYQVYTSHGDPNNLRYWRPIEQGGKWHYISHDFDWWRNLGNEPFKYQKVFTNYLSQEPIGYWIIGRMIQNETYREIFLNRLADLLNTAFEPEYVMGLIDSIDTAIDPEMPRDIARWSGSWFDNSGPTDYNMEYIRTLTEDYVVNYPKFIYSEVKDTLKTDTLKVTLTQTVNGAIQLNSISPDTRSKSWTGVYFENTAITLSANPEPGYVLTNWVINGESLGSENELSILLSDTPYLIEATFEAVSNNDIVINEINYNSRDDLDAGDWVELYNFSSSEIDLSGWVFKDDDDTHSFVIPEGIVIQPSGYVVLADDTTAFKNIHPGISFIKGEVNFGLDGAGDQVRIFNENEILMDLVKYDNSAPWPAAANGEGYTLELKSYDLDNSNAENWLASEDIGGTPGSLNMSTSAESESGSDSPKTFALSQNYPNPFNPSTNISFTLPETEKVSLKVFNILGQEVQDLVDRRMTAGTHIITFDASNLPSGVYIYRFKSGDFSETKKMILLK